MAFDRKLNKLPSCNTNLLQCTDSMENQLLEINGDLMTCGGGNKTFCHSAGSLIGHQVRVGKDEGHGGHHLWDNVDPIKEEPIMTDKPNQHY